MITLLRLTSLLLGGALIVVPPYALLLFAHALGEPHATNAVSTFLSPTLAIGLVLGAGPLLVGLPGLVAGAKNPRMRIVAAILLAISTVGFFTFGFEGYFTRVLTPIALSIEAVLLGFFIWPARQFSAKKPHTLERPKSNTAVR